MSKRPVLVTGGTGFIGRHLVTRLLDAGMEVVMLTRPSSILPGAFAGRVTRVDCADMSHGGLMMALRDQDFSLIYHLVSYGVAPDARDIMPMVEINAALPAALVVAAAERQAGIVIMGSCSEYTRPGNKTPLTEEASLETGMLYGSSKAAGGLLASAAAHRTGVSLRILRLFNVYGPGEAAHRLLPNLWYNLQKGVRVPLSMGTQVRDFVCVKDVVDAILQAGDSTRHDEQKSPVAIWNICTGTGSSVHTFAGIVASLLKVSNELLGFGDLPMREDELPWLVGSPAKTRAELGWQAGYDLESGLRYALDTMSGAGMKQD